MRTIYYYVLILVLLMSSAVFPVQARQVSTSIEPEKILIGEHVQLSFSLQIPREAILIPPVFNEKIHEKIEILDYGKQDSLPTTDTDKIRIQRNLTITSWEEGFHAIAPFEFTVVMQEDTLVWESEAILLEVEAFSIEEHTDLKDIKSIFSVPVTLAEVLPWVLGAILLAVLIYLLIRYLKKRKPKAEAPTIWEKPDVPAHIAAISSLEKLKSKKLWQNGKLKQYHSELTDILRHYIEKRFQVPAMEMTTTEIMQRLEQKLVQEGLYDRLKENLQLADLVKFAKHQPLADQNEEAMTEAFVFVHQTMPPEEEKPDSPHRQEQNGNTSHS